MKDIYEEALSDVKKLTKVAEDNAKLAIIEACTPRIREFIENQLMGGDLEDDEIDVTVDTDVSSDDDENIAAPGTVEPVGDLLSDNETTSSEDEQAAAVTLPDEEGKVTLDVDAVASPVDGAEEYEVTFENLERLAPIARAAKKTILGKNITSIAESVHVLKGATQILRSTNAYKMQVENALSRIENIYSHVQENVKDPAEKLVHENRLEAIFKDLNELQEQKMNKKQKKRLNEEDVTLTLTGLPDDIDLDSIGVDLVSGEDEVEDVGGEDQGADQGGDQGGDEVDFDALGGGDQGGQDQEVEEADEMIEIDEALLRREIKRMRSLRESEHKQGRADDADVLHDFGGGADDGDPWEDHDVTTADDQVNESEETMDEAEECNEEEEVQTEARRNKVSRGLKEASQKAAGKSAAARRSTEKKTEVALREKLAETNLFNAKLMYTNKLLQTESLSKRQKAHIIERLDDAKSIRDVKLVYESLVKTLSKSARTVSEGADRRVLGSSSRATSAASTVINEGYETDRWQRLAGIKK